MKSNKGMKKHSRMNSKKASCLSFFNSIIKDDNAIELMKISLKKEADRKHRLQQMLNNYEAIRSQEKTHIKSIKASIIQLKDVGTVPKIKYLVDPNIHVDNNLSIETRQFLSMLLNTFYKRYQQNKECQTNTIKVAENIRHHIKTISTNEELLFKMEKSNIVRQVQLEGQTLKQKALLAQRNKEGQTLKQEEERVKLIWEQKNSVFQGEKKKIEQLKEVVESLEEQLVGLREEIHKGEEIRQGNQQKMTGEMLYHMKFEQQMTLLKQQIKEEQERQKQLKRKIREKQSMVNRLKGKLNNQADKHEVEMRFLDYDMPRPSTKPDTVIRDMLEMEQTLTKTHKTLTQMTMTNTL